MRPESVPETGEKRAEKGSTKHRILATATDWKISEDMGGWMKLQEEIAITEIDARAIGRDGMSVTQSL